MRKMDSCVCLLQIARVSFITMNDFISVTKFCVVIFTFRMFFFYKLYKLHARTAIFPFALLAILTSIKMLEWFCLQTICYSCLVNDDNL